MNSYQYFFNFLRYFILKAASFYTALDPVHTNNYKMITEDTDCIYLYQQQNMVSRVILILTEAELKFSNAVLCHLLLSLFFFLILSSFISVPFVIFISL